MILISESKSNSIYKILAKYSMLLIKKKELLLYYSISIIVGNNFDLMLDLPSLKIRCG